MLNPVPGFYSHQIIFRSTCSHFYTEKFAETKTIHNCLNQVIIEMSKNEKPGHTLHVVNSSELL